MGEKKKEQDERGRLLPGNRLWEARSTAGPKPLFANGDDLWEACVEYFEWVEQNPLMEGITYQGAVSKQGLPKMRAMTLAGLCVFLDIEERTWRLWRDTRTDLIPVVTRVEAIIYEQKFVGASAGMLNPNIIARDLGLADKKELTGKDGGPIRQEVSTDAEAFTSRLLGLAARITETSGTGEADTGDEG